MEKALRFNSFGAPRTTRERFSEFNANPSAKERETGHDTAGIWLLASRINHSCAGNCRRSFIGDMQIVRAVRDMPAGTELLFTYCQPKVLESYGDAQKRTENWGFSCECELCMDKKATPKGMLEKRKARYQLLKKATAAGPSPTNIAKISAAIEKVEETYPKTSTIRAAVWDSYFELGIRLLAAARPTDGIEMIVKGFEALGYSIVAQPAAGAPRLEVKRWGLANDMAPWAFLRLADAYERLAPQLSSRAKEYAKLAYSIAVGESETIGDVFPGVA